VDQARDAQTEKSHFGFVIFTADQKKRKAVLAAYREFANAIYNIGNVESAEDDELMVTTIQMFGLGKK
jgi:hypothetical protein